MSSKPLTRLWHLGANLIAQRRIRNILTLALVALGPVLALVTFSALSSFDRISAAYLRGLLLADFIYVLVVAGLIALRVAAIIAARRRHSAGSRLHSRLSAVFALIALLPTILVAVFATLTVNFGLEGWFSDTVRRVVGNSLAAAQAYEAEHKFNLRSDAELLAAFLNRQKARYPLITPGEFRELLNRGQVQMQRELVEAYVIDGAGGLQARGERSYLFDYEPPTAEEMKLAEAGETVIIEDWENSEYRALVMLETFADRYLYVTRDVDGEILQLLDETQETVTFYEDLERDRGRLLFEFGLIYIGFAMIVILAAIWFGLWFAERLSRPVGQLAGAAQRVGAGDLDVQVKESASDDEIAMLGRVFNRMTRQVKGQRDALIEANEQTEMRRRLFDSVLSGVTAGVIGLDAEGRIEVVNMAARELLELHDVQPGAVRLGDAVPEFTPLFEAISNDVNSVAQGEVQLIRSQREQTLHLRMAARQGEAGQLEGYVVTFDDVSDLVSAQRMAAWGDVARRIAHEIKNPLTPIQLSAERLKRKFAPLVGDERAALEQYAEVIIRQTGDLRRIVDEFSKFARMPAPEKTQTDVAEILRDAVHLQAAGRADIRFVHNDLTQRAEGNVDETMISQAFINLLKNATEAIDSKIENGVSEDYRPEIRVLVEAIEGALLVQIQDNGIGLPKSRARLFEPYVTNRDKGTGLGLSIVKKIVEEHSGQLDLLDAPVFDGNDAAGAEARILLPLTTPGAIAAQ